MKVLILTIALLISCTSNAQELNVGLEFTGGPSTGEARIVALGPIVEYRPAESLVSINSGILFFVYKEVSLISVPLSLKFIIGNKIRFCPSFGGFIRTNGNIGWSLGLTVDYKIKKTLFLFIKGDYNRDYWKDEGHTHFEESYEYINNASSSWFGVGLKINIL